MPAVQSEVCIVPTKSFEQPMKIYSKSNKAYPWSTESRKIHQMFVSCFDKCFLPNTTHLPGGRGGTQTCTISASPCTKTTRTSKPEDVSKGLKALQSFENVLECSRMF